MGANEKKDVPSRLGNLKGLVRQALDDKSLTARLRLKRYLDIISGVLADENGIVVV